MSITVDYLDLLARMEASVQEAIDNMASQYDVKILTDTGSLTPPFVYIPLGPRTEPGAVQQYDEYERVIVIRFVGGWASQGYNLELRNWMLGTVWPAMYTQFRATRFITSAAYPAKPDYIREISLITMTDGGWPDLATINGKQVKITDFNVRLRFREINK